MNDELMKELDAAISGITAKEKINISKSAKESSVFINQNLLKFVLLKNFKNSN